MESYQQIQNGYYFVPRMQSPEIIPSISHQLIFDQGAKHTLWRKDSLVNKWCWDHWIFTCEKGKLYTTQNIDTKRIRYLNV